MHARRYFFQMKPVFCWTPTEPFSGKKEITKDDIARLQSKFSNLNIKVNQNFYVRQMDIWTTSTHKMEFLCNLAYKANSET